MSRTGLGLGGVVLSFKTFRKWKKKIPRTGDCTWSYLLPIWHNKTSIQLYWV